MALVSQFFARHHIINEHRLEGSQRNQQKAGFNASIKATEERLHVRVHHEFGYVLGKLSISRLSHLHFLMKVMITYRVEAMSRSQQVYR